MKMRKKYFMFFKYLAPKSFVWGWRNKMKQHRTSVYKCVKLWLELKTPDYRLEHSLRRSTMNFFFRASFVYHRINNNRKMWEKKRRWEIRNNQKHFFWKKKILEMSWGSGGQFCLFGFSGRDRNVSSLSALSRSFCCMLSRRRQSGHRFNWFTSNFAGCRHPTK